MSFVVRPPGARGRADREGQSPATGVFACAGPTWTAVTLYSGQFVAQSDWSVVTTLAPLTGWWNVV